MFLRAADRPELLATLSRIFIDENIKVHSAKISTVGAEVEDVFFITDQQDQPITDKQQLDCISSRIIEALSDN